jgi:hypothetical protein
VQIFALASFLISLFDSFFVKPSAAMQGRAMDSKPLYSFLTMGATVGVCSNPVDSRLFAQYTDAMHVDLCAIALETMHVYHVVLNLFSAPT